MKLPQLVIYQCFQRHEEERPPPVERAPNGGKLTEHCLARRSRRRSYQMFTAKNAKFVDGIQLQLVEPWNVAGPCIDHSLRKSKSGETSDLGSGDRFTLIGERGLIDGPWR